MSVSYRDIDEYDKEIERELKEKTEKGLIPTYKQINNNEEVSNGHATAEQEEEQEKETIIVEKVAISEAIRKNSGKVQVTGTITGITKLSKMISKAQLYCDKCDNYSECNFNLIPVENLKNIKERCEICKRLIKSFNIKPLDHKNTVMIELQDTMFSEIERLSVFLFDQDTVEIKVGENAEIIGDIK